MMRIDQAFFRRGVEHRAVIEIAAVSVGIGMRVKMYQRHLPEMFSWARSSGSDESVVAASACRQAVFQRARL